MAVSFLCHFPSAFAAWDFPSVLPFGVRTFLGPADAGPRSPGLQRQLYLGLSLASHARSAFGALQAATAVQHELAANEAFEACAALEREQLLVESPVEGRHSHG